MIPQRSGRVHPSFVLSFAVTLDAAATRAQPPEDLQFIPQDISASYRERLEALQQRLLGEPYLQARRLQRNAVGRMSLRTTDGAPEHADIHLVLHKSGAAVWEVWLAAPAQALGTCTSGSAGWTCRTTAASRAASGAASHRRMAASRSWHCR